jgi:hypothetical protein
MIRLQTINKGNCKKNPGFRNNTEIRKILASMTKTTLLECSGYIDILNSIRSHLITVNDNSLDYELDLASSKVSINLEQAKKNSDKKFIPKELIKYLIKNNLKYFTIRLNKDYVFIEFTLESFKQWLVISLNDFGVGVVSSIRIPNILTYFNDLKEVIRNLDEIINSKT